MNNKWVQVWGQAHSAFSFFYYPSCKKTYRLVIKSALSGKSVRFELSNECAKNDVEIGALSVAKCDKDGNFIGECKTATVNSEKSLCLKKGQVVLSDDVELYIKAGEYMFKNGILRNDIFSWSMNGKYWMSHEWLFEIIVYFLKSVFGKAHMLIYCLSSVCLLMSILFFTNKKNIYKNKNKFIRK